MKELEKVKYLLSNGVSRKYICKQLCISFPTLRQRLIDGDFNKIQKDKIKTLFNFK